MSFNVQLNHVVHKFYNCRDCTSVQRMFVTCRLSIQSRVKKTYRQCSLAVERFKDVRVLDISPSAGCRITATVEGLKDSQLLTLKLVIVYWHRERWDKARNTKSHEWNRTNGRVQPVPLICRKIYGPGQGQSGQAIKLFQAPRKISITFHFWHKSFMLDDVKLAVTQRQFWMKERDILGRRNILWPQPTYFQGVRTPNPQDLRPWVQ